MAFIYREWRVLAASAFAVAVIAGAYVLARGFEAPRIAEASTEDALLAQIANKDSTGDGLPDWQKPLYGIPLDATTTDYFHLGMTDGEAVAKGLIVPIAATPAAASSTPSTPDTAASFGLTAPASNSLTDSFAQNFFSLYISAEQTAGGSLTDDQINTVADQALTQLTDSVTPAPLFETAADIKVSGSGSVALKAYAANVQAIFAAHGTQLPESELQYLQDYLNGNTAALANIAQIATAYSEIATGLATLTIPQEVASTHLALVNALMQVSEASTDFSNADTDPLASMLALQQYPQDVVNLSSAFAGTAQAFASEGVTLAAGTPGASFVNLMATLQTQDASSTTP